MSPGIYAIFITNPLYLQYAWGKSKESSKVFWGLLRHFTPTVTAISLFKKEAARSENIDRHQGVNFELSSTAKINVKEEIYHAYYN